MFPASFRGVLRGLRAAAALKRVGVPGILLGTPCSPRPPCRGRIEAFTGPIGTGTLCTVLRGLRAAAALKPAVEYAVRQHHSGSPRPPCRGRIEAQPVSVSRTARAPGSPRPPCRGRIEATGAATRKVSGPTVLRGLRAAAALKPFEQFYQGVRRCCSPRPPCRGRIEACRPGSDHA